MGTYQLIGLLGLALGLAACFSMFREYYKPLSSEKKRSYSILALAGVLISGVALVMVVNLLSTYGEPGRSVLDTAGAMRLGIYSIVALVGLFVIFSPIRNANKTNDMIGQTLSSNRLPITHALLWAIRIYIAVLFIYSGFVKANDYIGFSYKLEEYFDVFAEYLPFMEGFWKFWASIAEPLAWFISVFEIALAVAILFGFRMNITIWLTLLMMLFFTFLTGFSAVSGKVTDCGCFGDALKLAPWESFTKDLIYMVMLIPLFLARKHISAFPNNRIAGILTAVVFLLTGIFSWYCHENLPVVDYRAYKVGTDLKRCTTEPGPDGLIKCKDWDEIYRLGEDYNLLEGKTLMIITHFMHKAPERALQESVQLAKKLKRKDASFQVICMTATGKSDLEENYRGKYGLTYDFSFRDATMLKTVVRSAPGYVLVKDGIILKKWHHNNVPSSEEVLSLSK